ncbi:DNA polymerase III subunit psi [[Haemophilus] felis]|nr:DNA polymerase III subunit psi [[Haemophilus] felis]
MTMNKRDFLLHEMGITQWQLRYPERLQGSARIDLPSEIKVVMLSDEAVQIQHPLLQDLRRSMQLDADQFITLRFAQIQHLQTEEGRIYWLLSDDATLLANMATQCPKATHIWQSPSWQQFLHSPQAKRQLWQQMQQQ